MNKKIIAIIVILFISFQFFAQKSFIKDFNSFELDTNRLLKIYVPKSYQEDGDRVYPLTIILDSEYLFDVYVANAKLFANKDKAPEQIIVGVIQNKDKERYIDCAYDKITSMPTKKSTRFYRFIRNEVLNYMDNNYRISPFKTIVGNALTANYINYFLIEKKPAFSGFINLNPSFALDIKAMLLDKIPSIDKNTYYYVISGNYNPYKKHKLIQEVDTLLKRSQNKDFNYRYDEVNKSTKVASIGQGISSALAFIFDQYSAISKDEFKNKVSKLSPPEAIEYLETKYVEIEYLFGANIKIRERDIYAIEDIIIDKENGDYLEEFGKMINRLYPESPVGDYYIGRYYETGKDYRRALKYYKNGYTKIADDDPNKDGYYQNVERILNIRKYGNPDDQEENEEEDIKEEEEKSEPNENEETPKEDKPE